MVSAPPAAAPPTQDGDAGAVSALWMSFAMIFVSEIGDKTFMLAAVMAMRHPRVEILAASVAALGLMAILSAALGIALPSVVSRSVAQGLASVLFLVFGLKMVSEARGMSGSEGQAELREVTKELQASDLLDTSPLIPSPQSGLLPTPVIATAPPTSSLRSSLSGLLLLFVSPVFVQTFIMVFLAEWGDRSQIASAYPFSLPQVAI